MPRTARLFLIIFTLAFASSSALAANGYWTKLPRTFAAVKAFFSTGTGTTPDDRQPDGGLLAKNGDGGVLVGPTQSGISLAQAEGLQVTVETLTGVDGGVMSAGTLQAYLYDAAAARWARAPDLDLTVSAGLAAQSFAGFTVTQKQGRIAYIPSGLGQPVNVYLSSTSSSP